MIPPEKLEAFQLFFHKHSSFAVIGHIDPDGDDISSVLSTTLMLRRLGKKAIPLIDSPLPEVMDEVPLIQTIRRDLPSDEKFPDAMIVVDASSPDRLGKFEPLLHKIPSFVIDHHRTNTQFGTFNWVDSQAAAAAQMVFWLAQKMEVLLDPVYATLNLLGLQTDSGFFKYSNTDQKLMQDAAALLGKGADAYGNASMILENRKPEEFKLMSLMLEAIQQRLGGLLVFAYLSESMFQQTGSRPEDSVGFVGDLRSMKGSETAILFVQDGEKVRVSFRSKKWFDVSEVAFQFGGGGHARAAGCSLPGDLQEIMDRIVVQVEAMMKDQLADPAREESSPGIFEKKG